MGFLELFEKTIGSIHFLHGIYHYGVSLLTGIHFRVPSLIFGPLVAKYLAKKRGFWNFMKKLLAQFISYQAFIFMWWVSWPLHIFVFLSSFSALWWPNIWLKMGFPELKKKKTIGSIHYIPCITLRGWVSWPLYIFLFLASFSTLWWPNIWSKMGFPELFEKTIGSIHFIHGIYPYGVSLLTHSFLCSWPHFRPSGGQIFGWKWSFKYFSKKLSTQFISYLAWNKVFLKNSHLCSIRLQNRNLYWIFLDEVGIDQSGDILSSVMGTACFSWGPVHNKSAFVQVVAWYQLGNKPLREPLLTKFHDTIWRHWTTMVPPSYLHLLFRIVHHMITTLVMINGR